MIYWDLFISAGIKTIGFHRELQIVSGLLCDSHDSLITTLMKSGGRSMKGQKDEVYSKKKLAAFLGVKRFAISLQIAIPRTYKNFLLPFLLIL